MMHQKAKIISTIEDKVLKDIGAYDDVWVQVGEPKPYVAHDIGISGSGEIVQDDRSHTSGEMYVTNIRLIDKDGNYKPEWAKMPKENVELVNEFLNDEEEKLPVYRLEVRV